jgi:hypothetical protein
VRAASGSGTLKIWRPADLLSLELRLGTSFQHPYPRHWHDEFFTTATTAGAGPTMIGRAAVASEHAHSLVLRPGDRFRALKALSTNSRALSQNALPCLSR